VVTGAAATAEREGAFWLKKKQKPSSSEDTDLVIDRGGSAEEGRECEWKGFV